MSRIDELIAELCPDGVEFESVGDLCAVFSGYAFKSVLFNTDGRGLPLIRIRDVNTGFSDTYYSGEFDERWLVNNGDILIGMDGDFVATRWKHGKALLNQRVCRLQDFAGRVLPDFVFYKIQDELDRIHSSITGSTVKHLSSRELSKSRIPVPPLEVQREIVRVLDQFTQLEAELEAELEARRRQYEHYRDQLLTFREAGGVRWIPMGEIATVGTGSHDTKDAVDGGAYVFYARGREPLSLDCFDFDEQAIITAGDGVGVGKVFHFAAGKYALHQRAYRIVPDNRVNTRFLYHYLVADFARYLERTSVHASVTSLRRPMFLKYPVPLLALSEQLRIVEILDRFDELVNDLSVGLPAELAARRKQYEYYRDRLLTFEEAAA